VLRKLKVLGQI